MDERVKHVADFIRENAIDAQIIEFDASTRNSQLAAKALNCPVGQIAKSIVFDTSEPTVVILSGDKRVDLSKLSTHLGQSARLASAAMVLRSTGFRIGGVPPFAHDQPTHVLLDKSLERFDKVYAAAGSSNAIMKIGFRQLRDSSGAEIVDVAV